MSLFKSKLIAQSVDISGDENFPSGCAFSPDGLCLLTCTAADSQLRLYNTYFPSAKNNNEINERDKNEQEASSVLPVLVPDGLCHHDWKLALSCHGGNAVRSYAWYPHMKSSDPTSCCFVAAARNQPVHLYDAYTGMIRASYRPYNALDEMESPTVTCFDPSGKYLAAAGFRTDRTIHIFETALPGREPVAIHRLGKTRRSSDGQKGLVSSLAYAVDGKYFAVGTYSPGSIYVYDHRCGQEPTGAITTVLSSGLCVVGHGRSHSRKKRKLVALEASEEEEGAGGEQNNDEKEGGGDSSSSSLKWLSSAKVKWFQSRAQGGVTQLKFSNSNEYLLHSTSRRSNAVLTWDLRMLSDNPDHRSRPISGIASYATKNDTNQRLEFDLDDTGEIMYIGGNDHCVRCYNTQSGELQGKIGGLDGPANGVSFFCSSSSTDATSSRKLLAVASGARHFPSEEDLDRDNDDDDCVLPSCRSSIQPPGYLRLFQLQN